MNASPENHRTADSRQPQAKWRLSGITVVPAAMALLGLTFYTYPTAAAWTTQYHQSRVISDYQQQVIYAEPEPSEQLRLAKQYNEELVSGAQLDPHANIARGTGAAESLLEYNKLLSAGDNGLMARIRIPAIDVDLPVFHGTSEQSLLAGAGHLQGTSLPVGGSGSRSVITAHRGLANAEMFTNLDRVKNGDIFVIEVFGEAYAYRVFEQRVIEPEETEAIAAVAGRDLATLITCTPLGVNSHRIILTGERIVPTPQEEADKVGEESELPRFPWFALWYLGGVAAIATFVWWGGRPPKRCAAAADEAAAEPVADEPVADGPVSGGLAPSEQEPGNSAPSAPAQD